MTQQRVRTPIRHNRARSDGTVGTLKQTIERDYGLPEGSVVLVAPSGRTIRSDARIATVRGKYE